LKITKDELTLVNDDALSKFYSGIKSQVTRKDYDKILKRVLCDILEDVLEGDYSQRARQICTRAKADPLWIDSLLNVIAVKLKKRTELPKTDKMYLNPGTIPNYFHPVKKLFVMNDVLFNWDKLFSTYPELDNINDNTRGYIHKEIQTMLQFSNGIMDRALILVLASSGIRKGAFKTLDWEDLQPVYRNKEDEFVFDVLESESKLAPVCALLRIYKKTAKQYTAIITPEAYQALMEYKKSWFAQLRREPKSTEPIFKQVGIPAVRRLDDIGIQSRMKAIVKRSGISKPLVRGQRLHEVPIMNGFRRFFNKNNKKSKSKGTVLSTLINKELMMGHQGMIPLDKNYYHELVIELIDDYLQAVPNLTIDESERLRLQTQLKDKMIEKFEFEAKSEIESVKKQLRENQLTTLKLIGDALKDPEKFKKMLKDKQRVDS